MWCTCLCSSAILLLLTIGVTKGNPTSTRGNTRVNHGSVQFHVIHTNDMHSRFEQTSHLSGTCSKSDAASNSCYGGFARIATLVRNARAGSTPTLFLNAGDTYQGTVWFTVYKWEIVARFLNILAPDAISLGNHEFDNGVDGLIPFLNNVTFPVLAANLNLTNEPELAATKIAKSTIIDIGGTQVGVIGYLTPETQLIASTGNVIFEDEVEAISKEARRLKESGVNILIAVGHSGFTVDKMIAAQVADIDLVIGGHTNTFLYTGNQPDSEIPIGLYPTAVTQKTGKVVYVVEAYAYTKYAGNISVTFDSEGELTHIEGNPILVDSSIEQAPDVLEELENWRSEINHLTNTVVGSTHVLLNGETEQCRQKECNLGNLITDAIVDYNSRLYAGSDGWTDAAIAVMNGGSIRTSISTSNDNKITMADVLAVFPFGNSVVRVSMTGAEILEMLEWSVHYLTGDVTEDLRGAFLQMSGMLVTYDLRRPSDSKVVTARVRCANCRIPVFENVNKTATYSVLMSDYMYAGGDNYTMIPSDLESTILDASVSDILIDYLGRRSPVYPGVEWRITFDETSQIASETESGAAHITHSLTVIILPLIIAILT